MISAKAVFLNYDQEALDAAYDQGMYAANRDQLVARAARRSDIARQFLGEPLRLAYGSTANEKLDIYRTAQPNAPICVFIHGGAWRNGSARDHAYGAEMLVHAGAHLVVPDFDNVVEAGGNLFVMADQVRRAVAWTYRNAMQQFGGDVSRLYVSGRSSGAHLGGVVAITDWQSDFGLPADAVKGYLLTSGMYDLRGPRLSKRSSYVKFTDEMEEGLSPQRHIEKIVAQIVLVYGSHETPEFQRQTCDFYAALRKAGKRAELILAEGYNHFEVAETIADRYGPAGRALLAQMELAGSL
jgi:arylformamidase